MEIFNKSFYQIDKWFKRRSQKARTDSDKIFHTARSFCFTPMGSKEQFLSAYTSSYTSCIWSQGFLLNISKSHRTNCLNSAVFPLLNIFLCNKHEWRRDHPPSPCPPSVVTCRAACARFRSGTIAGVANPEGCRGRRFGGGSWFLCKYGDECFCVFQLAWRWKCVIRCANMLYIYICDIWWITQYIYIYQMYIHIFIYHIICSYIVYIYIHPWLQFFANLQSSEIRS